MASIYERSLQELEALPQTELRRILNNCRTENANDSLLYAKYQRLIISNCHRLLSMKQISRRDFSRKKQIGARIVVPSYFGRQLRGAFIYKPDAPEDEYERFLTVKEYQELTK